MKKFSTSLAVSAVLMSGLANADTNPFGATELPAAYLQLAETEMACGANMKMEAPKELSKADAEKAAKEKAADEAAKKAAPKH
ncbi:MAG: hypothetical protein QX192_00985 [Methylococcales bacterium]